jgi:hypothetical protein
MDAGRRAREGARNPTQEHMLAEEYILHRQNINKNKNESNMVEKEGR